MSGGIADIAFHKEIAHHLLHAVHRIRCVNRFRTVSVITILPGALYAFREIGSIPFGHLPSHGDAVTLTKQLESLNGRSQRQFADICLRCFLIGETVCQDSHTIHIAETGISDGSLTGQDYLSLLMSGQSFLVELVNTDNRHGRTAYRIESCRQRSAQTVLTHQPTVRCVERRSFLRRTQVAAIPEARHVELAVRMLVTGLYLFPVVEIHIFQRLECDGNALFAILAHHLADNVQRQLFRSPAAVHTILHLLQGKWISLGIIPWYF